MRERRLTIVIATVVAALALAYALTATPLYTAHVAVTEMRDRHEATTADPH